MSPRSGAPVECRNPAHDEAWHRPSSAAGVECAARARAGSGAGPLAALTPVVASPGPRVADGDVVGVRDVTGDVVDVTVGVLDASSRWVFANGQSGALAAAVSERTGWPVVLVTRTETDPVSEEERASLLHAYVVTPSGEWLDAEGARPEAESREASLERYADSVLTLVEAGGVAGALAEHERSEPDPEHEVAAALVPAVLRYLDPPPPWPSDGSARLTPVPDDVPSLDGTLVEDAYGGVEPLETYDDPDWPFANGQCSSMALALHDALPGSRLVALVTPGAVTAHWIVSHEGRYVDVHGSSTAEEVLARSSAYRRARFVSSTVEDLLEDARGTRGDATPVQNWKLARERARTVIARL